jgi:hypothetical protein
LLKFTGLHQEKPLCNIGNNLSRFSQTWKIGWQFTQIWSNVENQLVFSQIYNNMRIIKILTILENFLNTG